MIHTINSHIHSILTFPCAERSKRASLRFVKDNTVLLLRLSLLVATLAIGLGWCVVAHGRAQVSRADAAVRWGLVGSLF